ncbi:MULTISPECIES: hypothetical protein [Streptosporangium]|uniref:Uncharacterized protein n=1 Tax=Streptosporangium brasiliense TaxID=47480 RepID=A0ABT9RK18_9ACTN|nr:hypothetical protein [Streptosporangium brasiliense]MDP9869649.1 hypothetical protein [Streptosporangium brasiliense]
MPHQAVRSSTEPPGSEPEVIHPDVSAGSFWDLYARRDRVAALVGAFGG